MAITQDMFFLNTRFEGTLQNQIQQMVAEGILSGRFRPGEKMPSTRKLARHLGVSRITVTLAYTELQANDYLHAEGRSGFYVSNTAPQPRRLTPAEHGASTVDWGEALACPNAEDAGLRKPADWRSYKYPFIYGQADPTLFDYKTWRLCALQALGQREFDSLTGDYADRDDEKLVEFVTRHILPRRGIVVGADEVLVTLGAQNGLWIAAQLLLSASRKAVIEQPCYPSLRDILSRTECQTEAVTVDRDGLPPNAVPSDTDVVFVTPSHQCPTNATMPMERRRSLLEAAERDKFLVVEDD
ncbi:MAG: PLP-dependent aminotransferase family protein [Planctomycetota bacterium]